jgi:dTDP-4-amino-4,6-dideoxygalactose transaminase
MERSVTFNKYINIIPKIDHNSHISGDGTSTKAVSRWFINQMNLNDFLLTTSCTHALEMASLLINIMPGDEVIAPSYTFVSTVNAFVLRGAKIVFVDIEPQTMNIDASLIEDAISKKTKAIVVVHYAGVSCDMDKIMEISNKYNLFVVEDAAQAVMSKYKGKYLGSIGHLGTFSFHETKNYTMGEGGGLVINDTQFSKRAEIIREKGTNRSNFLRGQIDKYTWVDVGSSYLPSDILASYLYPQLSIAERINENRIATWNLYYKLLSRIINYIELPFIPDYANHNAHMFYIKTKNAEERTQLIAHLSNYGIQAVFHYVPLHSSPAGLKYGTFHGLDNHTTIESERLLRLPLYYEMDEKDVKFVCDSITKFYK